MSYEIWPDHSKRYLLPPSVEDWIPARHPARFVWEFVQALDLDAEGFARREGEAGRPNYAPELLLAVWLYGYMRRIRSTRTLEEACREQLGLIWLTGQHAPDHNTLWRFWVSNRRALRRVIKRAVQVAVKAELVGLVLHAIDGTKVAAACSGRGAYDRVRLQQVVAQWDAVVEETIAAIESAQTGDGRQELPADWADAVRRRERLRELLNQVEIEERQHMQPTEPEARMVPTREGTKPGYNGQIVADAHSGLVVAERVTTAESDNHELTAGLAEVAENLGTVAATTVADAGYHAPEELETAARHHWGVVVAEPAPRARAHDPEGTYHARRFQYDAARDCCVCPRGVELRFESEKPGRRGGTRVRTYRCKVAAQCPVRWQCSKEARGRAIEIGPHHAVVEAQRARRATPAGRDQLRQRRTVAEKPFGTAKEVDGFRRFTVWGLESVRTQWSLLWTGFNLRKMYRWWCAGTLSLAAVRV